MLINADVKSLEVVTCAYQSRDPVLMDEVRLGKPFHDDNQARFGLPDRVTAKRFMFKLIYGASAYGFATDGDFTPVSRSQDFWQGVIDEFYRKYKVIQLWHDGLVAQAIREGKHVTPSGRVYTYPTTDVAARGWYWRPKILNYPVQGFGADLVMIARITLWNRINRLGLKCLPISSVHDSIVVDVDTSVESWYTIGKVMRDSIIDVPMNFKRLFGTDFDLPMNAEIKYGPNLGEMQVASYD